MALAVVAVVDPVDSVVDIVDSEFVAVPLPRVDVSLGTAVMMKTSVWWWRVYSTPRDMR